MAKGTRALEFVTAADVARANNLHPDTVGRLIARGVLKARRLGDVRSKWRIDVEDAVDVHLWYLLRGGRMARRVTAGR